MKNSPLLILLCTAATAQLPTAPGSAALQKLEVQAIEIIEFSSDRVRLRLLLDGVAERDVHLRAFSFDDVSINGVPVFVPPRLAPLRMKKGSSLAAIEPLEATVFYRDLPSLEPVRRLVREEKATVRATVRLQPNFSLLQRVTLWTSSAWVSTKVERTVRVHVPGGSAGKAAAELGLAAADAVWIAGQMGFQWRRDRNDFLKQVMQLYLDRVLPVTTRYTIARADGSKTAFVWRGLAFHAGYGKVVTTAEAVEPWRFDSGIAELLATGSAELLPESLDTAIGQASTRKGTAVLRRTGKDTSKGLSVARKKTFPLRDRSSPANFAVLGVEGIAGLPVRSIYRTSSPFAVFRIREGRPPELLSVAVAQDKNRLRLTEPVDARVFGSPVVGLEGVLGIVVSHTSILGLDTVH